LRKEKKEFGFLPGVTPIINPRKMRSEIFKKNFSNIGMKWYGSSHSYAIQSADPTADFRLVEFSFSIDEEFFNKKGNEKYLLRNTMDSKIPDYILQQQKSYFQSTDIGRRLTEDDSVLKILEEIKKNKKFHFFVDFIKLESIFVKIYSNNRSWESISQSSKIIKIISLFYFLKRLNYI
jgi:HD superfamily phosphohydrolase